jgi:hypothetical protein
VTEGAFARGEALLALNPIHRAQQKSKEREHVRENVMLNGLQTTRQEQYSWLEIGLSPFVRFFAEMEVDSIPLSKLEPEIEPILDGEARQALTERTSTTRTTKGGQIACRRIVPATLLSF